MAGSVGQQPTQLSGVLPVIELPLRVTGAVEKIPPPWRAMPAVPVTRLPVTVVPFSVSDRRVRQADEPVVDTAAQRSAGGP